MKHGQVGGLIYHGAAGRFAADGLLQGAGIEQHPLAVVVDEHGVELLVGAEDRQPGLRLCAIKLQQAGRDLERTHSIAANGSAVASDCCCR
jgi:hypothetical protein